MRRRRYKSRIAEVVHKDAAELKKLGLVDKKTMREFDALCLTSAEGAWNVRDHRQA